MATDLTTANDSVVGTITPLCLRVDEAARMLRIGKTKIYALMAEGRLQRVKIGSRSLIPLASVEALLRGEDDPQAK
jgi:excisionase family DNA binding protein